MVAASAQGDNVKRSLDRMTSCIMVLVSSVPPQANADWNTLSQAKKDGHLKRLIKQVGKKLRHGNFTSSTWHEQTGQKAAVKQSGCVPSANRPGLPRCTAISFTWHTHLPMAPRFTLIHTGVRTCRGCPPHPGCQG